MRTEDAKALAAELRAIESRSKGPLLKRAAEVIETLVKQLEAARAERDIVTKRMIELEQRVAP